MKFALTVTTVAALAASVLAQDGPVINSLTNVVQCQPIQLSWSGGAPPYWVTLVDGNNPNGAGSIIKELVTESNTQSFTWIVDVPLAKYDLQIRDGAGRTNNNAPFDIIAGSSSACLNASSSSSDSASSTASSASSSASSASSVASSASSVASSASSVASSASSVASSISSASSHASSASSHASSTSSTSSRTTSATSGAPAATTSGSGNSATTLAGSGVAGLVGAIAAFFLA